MKTMTKVLVLHPAEGLSRTYNWVIIRFAFKEGKEKVGRGVDDFYMRRGVKLEQMSAFDGIGWAKGIKYNKVDCLAVKLGKFYEVLNKGTMYA